MKRLLPRSVSLGLTAKSLAAPLLITALLIAVGVVSLGQFNVLERQVQHVADDLAPGTGAAAGLMRSTLRQQIAANDFMHNLDPAAIEAFEEHNATFQRTLEEARQDLPDGEARDMLDGIEERGAVYADGFRDDVVANMQEMDRLVEEGIIAHGSVAEEQLTNILQTAYEAGDAYTANNTANALHGFMTARLAVQQFLLRPGSELAEQADEAIEQAEAGIDELVENIIDAREQGMAETAQEHMALYKEDF